MPKMPMVFFLSGFSFTIIHDHSRITGLQGNGEGIFLTSHYHFHPVHRHSDISRAITAESSPLHIDVYDAYVESCFSNVTNICPVTLLKRDCTVDIFHEIFQLFSAQSLYETTLNLVMGFCFLSKPHNYLIRLYRVKLLKCRRKNIVISLRIQLY